MTRLVGLQTDMASAIALGASSERLTWTPPGWNGTGASRVAYTTNLTNAQAEVTSKYPGYTAVIINDSGLQATSGAYSGGGHIIDLPVNQDFVLLLNQRAVAAGTGYTGVNINGGRNVVLIGGKLTLPMQSSRADYDPGAGGLEANEAALKFNNCQGIIHVEGVNLTGFFVRGMAFDNQDGSKPLTAARFQFQNMLINGCLMWKENSSFAHSDIILMNGYMNGAQGFYYDKITATADNTGFAAYWGDSGSSSTWSTINYYKRVNVRAISQYGGGAGQCAGPNNGGYGFDAWFMSRGHTQNVLDQCWMETGYFRSGSGDCPTQESTKRSMMSSVFFTDANNIGATPATSTTGSGTAQGDTLTFTDPATDHVYGRGGVGNGMLTQGVPPTGDFVPSGVAGSSYVSPGYLP